MIIEIKKPITRMKVEKALSKIKKERGTPKKQSLNILAS
jgi:hypothetical protein